MERSFYFDNLKGFLMFLVVLGHYLGTGFVYTENSPLIITTIYIFIYTFHMPLFAFLSGYLIRYSSNDKAKLFKKLFLPYILLNSIFIFLLGSHASPILEPQTVLWYLLALFIWRISIEYLSNVRGLIFYSVIMSICAQFLSTTNQPLMRVITFFPFFLIGFYIKSSFFEKITKFPKWISYLVIIVFFTITIFLTNRFSVPYTISQYNSVLALSYNGFRFFVFEVVFAVIGIVTSIVIVNLVNDKKSFLTQIGKNSIVVYLLHSFPYLREFLDNMNTFENDLLSFIYWLTLSLFFTWLLSREIIAKIYSKSMDKIADLIIKEK